MNAKDTINRLVEENQRLAYYLAHRWAKKLTRYPLTQNEIESDCLYGLFKAARTFDESKGYRFATYATHCINNEVLQTLRKYKVIKIPISSLTAINSSGDEFDQWNLIQGDQFQEDISDAILSEMVIQAEFKKLDKREKQILYLYANGGYTQKEISKLIGISQSYISRIIKKLQGKMKLKLNA